MLAASTGVSNEQKERMKTARMRIFCPRPFASEVGLGMFRPTTDKRAFTQATITTWAAGALPHTLLLASRRLR